MDLPEDKAMTVDEEVEITGCRSVVRQPLYSVVVCQNPDCQIMSKVSVLDRVLWEPRRIDLHCSQPSSPVYHEYRVIYWTASQ